MIEVKPGVIFKALKPEIYGLFPVIDKVFNRFSVNAVITSAADGKHKTGSFHYKDLAIDLRAKHLKTDSDRVAVRDYLRHDLGENYDVLLEGLGTPGCHFHIEFDPKLR